MITITKTLKNGEKDTERIERKNLIKTLEEIVFDELNSQFSYKFSQHLGSVSILNERYDIDTILKYFDPDQYTRLKNEYLNEYIDKVVVTTLTERTYSDKYVELTREVEE